MYYYIELEISIFKYDDRIKDMTKLNLKIRIFRKLIVKKIYFFTFVYKDYPKRGRLLK